MLDLPQPLLSRLVGIYLTIVIFRLAMDLARADYNIGFVQGIYLMTNPPLRLLRRVVPGLYGFDLSIWVFIWLLATLKMLVQLRAAEIAVAWGGLLVMGLGEALYTVAWIFILAVLLAVVVSWVAPYSLHPAVKLMHAAGEPIMRPFRRRLPSFAGLDFSPLAALLALNLAQSWLFVPLKGWGFVLMAG